MLASTNSTTLLGVQAHRVLVEVDVARGLPHYTVVGLPDKSVSESFSRVWGALRNTGYSPPLSRVTVNLAPGDIRKEGPRFDLAIALALIASDKETELQPERTSQLMALGELSMEGCVLPVRGVLASVVTARDLGIPTILVPAANSEEAQIVAGIRVVPVATLKEALNYLLGLALPSSLTSSLVTTRPQHTTPEHDFADVRGQYSARRAAEICAAGRHHFLMIGPPGAGKTLIANCLSSILPPLCEREALEVTTIKSAVNGHHPEHMASQPPFRAPASTISLAGLLGGQIPGEISLAHCGILFLDEFLELRRDCLEALRSPLETGSVAISRAHFHTVYPCRCTLVAATNPCPCGYSGDAESTCTCSQQRIANYRHRLSGPLLDRIDLQVHVGRLAHDELLHTTDKVPESSAAIRERVLRAASKQKQRGSYNAHLNTQQTREYCQLSSDCARFLRQASLTLDVSARMCDRLIRVARTIADLDGRESIELPDIAEALQYRTLPLLSNSSQTMTKTPSPRGKIVEIEAGHATSTNNTQAKVG